MCSRMGEKYDLRNVQPCRCVLFINISDIAYIYNNILDSITIYQLKFVNRIMSIYNLCTRDDSADDIFCTFCIGKAPRYFFTIAHKSSLNPPLIEWMYSLFIFHSKGYKSVKFGLFVVARPIIRYVFFFYIYFYWPYNNV